ncbi:UNVERIFIED_CONTAM: hypothetical protein FKN15_013743 [Acipenser sinensis]
MVCTSFIICVPAISTSTVSDSHEFSQGKKDMPLESEVVLTKMKILTNNIQAEFVSTEESLANDSIAESDMPSESHEEPHSLPGQTQNKPGYLTAYADLSTEESKCSRLSKLFKFESEDSGVELPSGANSPSTPTGSEQSFIVHSRGSSCDSGDLSTSPASGPVMDHIFLLSKCPEMEEMDNSVQQAVREKNMESSEPPSSENTPNDFTERQKTGGSFFNHSHENIVEETDKDVEEAFRLEVPTEIPTDDTRPVGSGFREAFDDMTEGELEEQRLQKYSTSDSLDEYMDECWKKDMPLESEVVLTKMKILTNNIQAEFVSTEESLANDSIAESDMPSESHEEPHSLPGQTQNKPGYLTAYADLSTEESKCSRLSKLFKFESEDSGVELPSGANSPSTPTGSEQSFIVHSRGSSCDSGDLSTSPASGPVMDHIFLLSKCPEMEEMDNSVQQAVREKNMESSEPPSSENTPNDFTERQKTGGSFFNHSHENIVEETDKDVEEAFRLEVPTEIPTDDTRPVGSGFREAFDDMTEGDLEEQRLQKYSTSDSLDEYMDECCRLSEPAEGAVVRGLDTADSKPGPRGLPTRVSQSVHLQVLKNNNENRRQKEKVNQGKVKALGSGLGYLEHICQLIEKIGQLQEHNLKLQKQICGLHKESRMKQTKEEYFLQHCSCGAATLAFQELKRHSIHRSEFHNLTLSNSTLSDLSTIPEIARRPDRLRKKGTDAQAEPGHNPLASVLRRSRRSWVETDRCDSEEALTSTLPQTQTMRRSENHHWGKVKDLVKKTKLRNQSRLGLSSNTLKRSCPQLYRPDLGSADLPRRDRNSMIALGNKHEYLWPH